MNKLVLQYILLFVLIINSLLAFPQKQILKLDDSKSYELFFIYNRPRNAFSVEDIEFFVKNNYKSFILYPNDTTTLLIDTVNMTITSKQLFYCSKKTGITFNVFTTMSFLVDDKENIKNLKENWTGTTVKELPSCGFDYAIYIKDKDEFINTVMVNTECKYGGSSWGDFEFEESPLKYLTKKEKLITAKIECTSIEQSRNIIEDLEKLDNVYLHSYGFIPDFNGSFDLEFRGNKKKKFENKLRQEITKAYPNEKFDIFYLPTYPRWRIFKQSTPIEIQCEKSLGDIFTLYKMEREWEPFSIDQIEIFFKDKSQIDGLIDKYTKE